MPKKNYLHSGTGNTLAVHQYVTLPSGFRHGPYLVRFRQAQMAGRTIEDMEVREATTPAYRAREGHGRYVVGTKRRNHGVPPFRLFAGGNTPRREVQMPLQTSLMNDDLVRSSVLPR